MVYWVVINPTTEFQARKRAANQLAENVTLYDLKVGLFQARRRVTNHLARTELQVKSFLIVRFQARKRAANYLAPEGFLVPYALFQLFQARKRAVNHLAPAPYRQLWAISSVSSPQAGGQPVSLAGINWGAGHLTQFQARKREANQLACQACNERVCDRELFQARKREANQLARQSHPHSAGPLPVFQARKREANQLAVTQVMSGAKHRVLVSSPRAGGQPVSRS